VRRLGGTSEVKNDRLIVDSRWLGAGYGYETEPGRAATLVAASLDLPLDPSYTAKAFAGALALVKGRKTSIYADWNSKMPLPSNNVLYWHTLSAPGSLQAEASRAPVLPRNLRGLLQPCPAS
jgi:1-aminocyclopropane-1-carboxylate deaminase/D-cysteine desulfhydrase-like pyridoxal-dependent ACC family enzyme